MSTDVVVSDRGAMIADALDYRRQSASYADISSAMGISVKEAIQLVSEGVGKVTESPALTDQLDLERINLMINSLFQQASSGDVEAINTVGRLITLRRTIEAKTPTLTRLFE